MNHLSALDDVALIRLFKGGQEKAFDILFLRYKADLTRVVQYYVKDKFVAEDLVQDAFFKILSSLQKNKYHEEGKFLPWALRIAHNVCMDHLRKEAKAPLVSVLEHHHNPHTTTSAETNMMERQMQIQLNLLLNQLSKDQKEVVCLRHFEDLSFKEISSRMNTSVNTSLGRMRYGLLHLRKIINTHQGFVWR